jgi:hypothetical protein
MTKCRIWQWKHDEEAFESERFGKAKHTLTPKRLGAHFIDHSIFGLLAATTSIGP